MTATTSRFVTCCLDCFHPTGPEALSVGCWTCADCGHHNASPYARHPFWPTPCPDNTCRPEQATTPPEAPYQPGDTAWTFTNEETFRDGAWHVSGHHPATVLGCLPAHFGRWMVYLDHGPDHTATVRYYDGTVNADGNSSFVGRTPTDLPAVGVDWMKGPHYEHI